VFDSSNTKVKIETVPQRVARAALQLDETGVNGNSFHAQTGRIRPDERGLGPVQIPLAHTILMASYLVAPPSRLARPYRSS
jgi:hypothetical protein